MDNDELDAGISADGRKVYAIYWTDPDESPLGAIGRLNQEVIEVAADARRPYAVAQMANIMKLQKLAEDATEQYDQAYRVNPSGRISAYWAGQADAYKRAISVLEGRG